MALSNGHKCSETELYIQFTWQDPTCACLLPIIFFSLLKYLKFFIILDRRSEGSKIPKLHKFIEIGALYKWKGEAGPKLFLDTRESLVVKTLSWTPMYR